MFLQRFLYNQCNTIYRYDDAKHCICIDTTKEHIPNSPVGNLSLHPLTKALTYGAYKAFAQENAYERHACADRYTWLLHYARTYKSTYIIVMDAAEPYISKRLEKIKKQLAKEDIHLDIRPNTQFLIDHISFTEQFSSPPIMETFYRWMRKKTNILMENNKPVGGKRNYDKDNRKFDKNFDDTTHLTFSNNPYREEAYTIYAEELEAKNWSIDRYFPITRAEALELLSYFITHHLDTFWKLEDAMYDTSDMVYHSWLSVPLNLGLLTAQEVIYAIQQADTAIQNKEGFIRQVLWWREYMYHWHQYYQDTLYKQNFFKHTLTLPKRFWRPEESTLDMHCVNHVLKKVDRTGYSHHIERLMIIGNFCLLVGFEPTDVTKWFWEQFVDAYERVVSPNVMGMSQYADGGKLATKPYVSSANYVNKMSNFCSSCTYNPKEKYWPTACPLNYLYRTFVDKNKELFKKGRQWFVVKHLEKIDTEQLYKQRKEFLKTLTPTSTTQQ